MRFPDWFKKNDFAANIFKLMTGTALGQLISILIAPILARIYTPDDFGILAIYISIVTILSVAISLRFELAILLPSDDDEAVDLVILGIFLAALLSLFLLPFFFFFNKDIANLIDRPEVSYYLYLVPLSTFFYGSFQVLSYWMSRIKNFGRLATAKVSKEATIAATQLSIGTLLSTGAFGLIAGQIMGNAVGSAILFVKSYHTIRQRITSKICLNLKSVFIKYKKFPQFTSWAALLNAISQNIPAILLAFLFSPATAGYYAIAVRVLMLPTALIGNSVRQVYYQKTSELYNTGKSIRGLFFNTTRYLILIAIVPFSIIILWGEPLFLIVFGPEWGKSGQFASILSFWIAFVFINPPSLVNIYLLKLNKMQLILEMLLLTGRIAAIVVGYIVFDDVIISILLFTIVGVISNIFMIGFTYIKLSIVEKQRFNRTRMNTD